jgi:hypothetical protein
MCRTGNTLSIGLTFLEFIQTRYSLVSQCYWICTEISFLKKTNGDYQSYNKCSLYCSYCVGRRKEVRHRSQLRWNCFYRLNNATKKECGHYKILNFKRLFCRRNDEEKDVCAFVNCLRDFGWPPRFRQIGIKVSAQRKRLIFYASVYL